MAEQLTNLLVDLKNEKFLSQLKDRATKEDPVKILDECKRGMEIVGERFEKGEYFLAELMLSGQLFKEASAILEPYLLESGAQEYRGTIVLATLKGDIHDLGKDIFATLARAHGFEVHDLGVDVPASTVVDKVKEVQPNILGYSCLITTSFEPMKEATEEIEREGLREKLKLTVGGGATDEFTKKYLNADFQTTDAAEGINYCLKVVGGELNE